MAVDLKGLNGTRDMNLPRFGPSDGGKSLRPACLVLTGLSITRGDLLALAFDCLFSLAVRSLDLFFNLSPTRRRGSPLYT